MAEKAKEIQLTDNTVENIRIMAPYLDETSQNRVFGMMLEAVKNLEDSDKEPDLKAG